MELWNRTPDLAHEEVVPDHGYETVESDTTVNFLLESFALLLQNVYDYFDEYPHGEDLIDIWRIGTVNVPFVNPKKTVLFKQTSD